MTSLALVFLVSCGSGVQQSASDAPVQSGATDVATTRSFPVTFTSPIAVDTVTTSSFFLVQSSSSGDLSKSVASVAKSTVSTVCDPALAIPATVTCQNLRNCTLTPTAALENDATYVLCLTSAIEYQQPSISGTFVAQEISFTTAPATTYTVGGTVTGLSGTVVLQNNSGDNLSITASGSFTFATAIADGSTYGVTVLTQPSTQTCTASSNTGTVSGANVTSVSVTCSTNTYTVGGTVTGLSGTVVLQNNSGDNLTLTSSGSFTFTTAVADGASYSVAVLTQPSTQTCTASSNTGTVNGANVTSVAVTCSTNTYTVGGTVTGLTGTVVLQNNSGDNLTLTSSGSFTFSTVIADGSTYAVTVLTQPSGQTCTPSSSTGTVSGANVTSVTVTCTTNPTYTVGGTLSSLGGSESVILQNNGGDDLSLSSNGSFTLATALQSGATYSVTVLTNPSRQTCTVTSGSGTIASANITNITVECVTTSPVFFVTASGHNGNLGGISGADALCMADSNKPAAGTYKAVVADNVSRRACSTANCSSGVSEHIDWVLAASTTYYRSNGTTPVMTTNSVGIFPYGALTNSILGATTYYWTGIQGNWVTDTTQYCTGWTATNVNGSGGVGDATTNNSIYTFALACSNTLPHVLCVEQ